MTFYDKKEHPNVKDYHDLQREMYFSTKEEREMAVVERDKIEAMYKLNPTKELREQLRIARGNVLRLARKQTKIYYGTY